MAHLEWAAFAPWVLGILIGGLVAKTLWKAANDIFFHPLRAIPGPPVAKVLGSYLIPALVAGRRAQTLLQLHQKYGPVVRVGPNEVSVSDYTVYRDIYNAKNSGKEETFYRAGTFLGHENIFSMRNAAQHTARRRMQSQPYSQAAVLENESLIASKAAILRKRLVKQAQASSSGTTADVYALCGLFSLEVVLQCAFNHSSGEASDSDSAKYLRTMEQSAQLLPIDVAMPFLKKFGIGKYVPGYIGRVFRAFDTWIAMTRALLDGFQTREKAFDLSHRFMATPLLVNDDKFLGRHLTVDEVVEEAMGIAFAGSGTTSTTLIYLIYALSRPEAIPHQERLRNELHHAAGIKGGPLALKELQELPFLSAIIKETMRLYPTIISTLPRTLKSPIIVRTETRDLVLPPGVNVGMQNYVHHRDPQVFPEPEQFLPMRWLTDTMEDALREMNSAITPFSVGPRNCIGQNLARAELYLAVGEIFGNLKVKLNHTMRDDDMEMEDRFNIAPKGRKLAIDVYVV